MIGAVVGGIAGSFAGQWALGAQMGAAVGGSFATGGRYPVGRNIWVGEEGPELVRLDRPGEIIPNHRIGSVGSATSPSGIFDGLGLGELSMSRQMGAQLAPLLQSQGGASMQRAVETIRQAVIESRGNVPGASAGVGDVAQSITIFGGVHGDGAAKRAGKAWGSSLQDAVAMR